MSKSTTTPTTADTAAAMYAAGSSVNAVAKSLNITWNAARKLKPEFTEEETAEEEASDDRWDLPLRLSLENAGRIFDNFSDAEKRAVFDQLPPKKKMDTILGVLQERMDSLCKPESADGV